MILHGDGSTNIFVKDGLLDFKQYKRENAPNALNNVQLDSLYHNKEINGQFDLIMSNPPFSVELDNTTKQGLERNFLFGGKKNSENLFISCIVDLFTFSSPFLLRDSALLRGAQP